MVEQPLELAIARLQPVDELLRDDIVCRAGQAADQWRHVRVVLLNGGHHVLERHRSTVAPTVGRPHPVHA